MLDQTDAPLLKALQSCAQRNHTPFYTPGHKQGRGISPPLAELLGLSMFRADLTELLELDNLFAPQGVIQEAQQLAASAFGAEHTWFLVNGSSCGIVAAILAICSAGNKIILPRNIHQSAIHGLILSGAVPVFVSPESDPSADIAHSITSSAVAVALQQHPDAKAVLMVYPTYYGACGDVAAIAHIAHQYNIPLLVDEAHGAHFAFHSDLPPSALASGADLTVQSTHKVLSALTQASMLHVQGSRIDIDRLRKALQLVQSSSPSYLLLASLDAARQQMALHGKQLMSKTLHLAEVARSRIREIPGLSILEAAHTQGFIELDQTRLTINVSELGITGFEADEILNEQLNVTSEVSSLQHLTFIISLGNTEVDIDHLVQALSAIAQDSGRSQSTNPWQNVFRKWKTELMQVHPASFIVCPSLSPREAFFAATEMLSVEQIYLTPLSGEEIHISAELVCPYPPGIPVLMPGEVVTPAALDYLQQILALGGSITGCSDPTLQTLKVVQK